jgi:hypothetical protein
MTDLDTLYHAVDELSPEEKRKLVEYIQQGKVVQSQPVHRVIGLHPNAIWMSEDFDEELPDSFWLGEE